MIDPAKFGEICAMYQKHGWVLRRVLVASPGPDAPSPAQGVLVSSSNIDAAWFSRPPRPGQVAWEIRYLGETPFALVQSFDEADPNFESGLREMEARLHQAVAAKA